MQSELTPSQFQFRKRMRQSAILVVLMGVAAAIFGILAKLQPEMTVQQLLASPGRVLLITGVAFVYCSYLMFVVNHALLQREVQQLGGLASTMPFLLLAAYVSMPLDHWVIQSKGVVPAWSFMGVYGIWMLTCAMSISGYRAGEVEGMDVAEDVVWFFVDLCAIITLAFDIARAGEPLPILGVQFAFKDIAVGLSVIGCIAQEAILHFTKQKPFPQSIGSYIRSLQPLQSDDQGVGEVAPLIQRRLPSDKRVCVLDFGAGDSARTLQLLDRLGVGASRIQLFRYDIVGSWALHGPTKRAPGPVAGVEFTSSFTQAANWAKTADVIVASHALYEPKAVRDFAALIQSAKQGTTVLLRGGSPESFLAPIVMYRLFSWMRPFYAAYWDEGGLAYIAQTGGLRPLVTHGDNEWRAARLGQLLIVKEDQLDSITQALECTYGKRVARSLRRMMEMAIARGVTVNGTRAAKFMNPDLVYIGEKTGTVEVVVRSGALSGVRSGESTAW